MISVVMPLCDTNATWLHESISSLLNQTFQNFELLIINNGSKTQETINFLSSLKNNSKIKIINLKYNYGISYACNIGIKNSQYDYIARMDSDDICLPSRLQIQYDHIQKNNEIDVLGSNCRFMFFENDSWILKNSTNHPCSIDQKVIDNNLWFINHPTVIFKKEAVISVGGYDESPDCIVEDYDLWIRMYKANKKICNISNILLYYRQHQKSYTKKFKINQFEWQKMKKDQILNGIIFKKYLKITLF